LIGRSVSHYRILGELGAGGMGVVYLAEDERLGRQIAVKFLPKESTSDKSALERFRVEARAASSLSHPGICAIHDIGMDGDAPFIVMELLKGETLRERLARGPLKVTEVLDIGMQLADALGAAHAHGIIHRDIKPANIFLVDKTRAKLLDFGLAKLAPSALLEGGHTTETVMPGQRRPLDNQITLPGSAVGTVCYMSPEQARGEEIDARTDIFSLGVVLYEMATGHQAFGGSTTAVSFDAILNRSPAAIARLNPQIPERFWPVIATAIEKEPDLRFQHATELLAELKRVRRDLESGPVGGATRAASSAATVSIAAPQTASADAAPAPRAGRGPWPAIAGAFAVLALIGFGYSAWMWTTSNLGLLPSERAIPSAVAVPAGVAANAPPASSAPESAALAPPATPPAVTSPSGAERRPRESPPPNRAPSPPPKPAADTPRPAPAVAAAPPAVAAPLVPTPSAPAPAPEGARPASPPAMAAPVEPVPAPAPAAAARTPAETVKLPAASPSEESAIREVIASYERAIETKSIDLFRSVRPGLSAAEEARLRESFRQVVSQEVTIRILDLKISGASATVRLSRVDTIVSAGRRQTQNSQQTLRLNKTASGWVIAEIGR
jgi:serine/threonine protein kinase